MTRTPTQVSDSASEPGRGATRLDPTVQDVPSTAARPSTDSRKLTGVLVTFTWRPQGELFELREGKNFIGRGTVDSEGGRPCDMQIHADAMMSNEHALILCRAGRYQLFDQQSTSGSFVNDAFVESQGVNLNDRDKIKTGATVWTFLKIDSGPFAMPVRDIGQAPPAPDDEDTPPRETRVR